MPADVDQQVLIDAFVRFAAKDGEAALEKVWRDALRDTMEGVQVTSVTFEGASGSGVAQEFNSAKLLAVVQQALEIVQGKTGNDRVTHATFAGGYLQT